MLSRSRLLLPSPLPPLRDDGGLRERADEEEEEEGGFRADLPESFSLSLPLTPPLFPLLWAGVGAREDFFLDEDCDCDERDVAFPPPRLPPRPPPLAPRVSCPLADRNLDLSLSPSPAPSRNLDLPVSLTEEVEEEERRRAEEEGVRPPPLSPLPSLSDALDALLERGGKPLPCRTPTPPSFP